MLSRSQFFVLETTMKCNLTVLLSLCRDGGFEGGRKRRSEMSAPIPIVKESIRADSERQSHMVTLRRGGTKNAPSSSSSSASERGSQVNKSSSSSAGGSDDKRKERSDNNRSGAEQVSVLIRVSLGYPSLGDLACNHRTGHKYGISKNVPQCIILEFTGILSNPGNSSQKLHCGNAVNMLYKWVIP